MELWVMTNEYQPYIVGGLGVVATNLSRALAEDGLRVTVLSQTARHQVRAFEDSNMRIIRFPKERPYYAADGRKYQYEPVHRWLDRHIDSKPDLIQIHSVEYAGAASYYKKRYKVPLVYTCHSLVALEGRSPIEQVVENRQRRMLDAADCIVVPSQWAKRTIEQTYPGSHKKINVIENGVHIQRRPNLHSDHRNLLYVGRLIPSKGIEELLRAIALVKKKEPAIRLSVIGRGTAAYERKLKGMTAALGLKRNVRWIGYVAPEQVLDLYRSFGTVVVPSLQETFGLVALEALANGVPLISTNAGGLAQFVNDEVAEVIPQVNSREIAASIQKRWGDAKRTRKRVEQGLNLAKPYNWSRISIRYRELFHNLLAERAED